MPPYPPPNRPLSSEDNSTDDQDDSSSDSSAQAVHYFAIGSMTNRTALSLRELSPISSQAAILKGYRLLFRGSGGMATAEKIYGDDYSTYHVDASDYPFDGIHGVLHLLTMEHMKTLDEYEGGYFRKQCVVTLYDGTEVLFSK